MAPTPSAEALRRMGETLAERRRNRGLSQGQLAELAGVTVRTISRAETGQGSFDTCCLLAQVLEFNLLAAVATPEEAA